MKFSIFPAILLFSIFSRQVHAANDELTKDEEAYARNRPFEFFSDFEYELEVNTDRDIDNMHYSGSVLIKMKCIQKTNKIFLDRHSIIMNEKKIRVWKHTEEKGDKEITVLYGRNVNDKEGYKIKLESYMKVNSIYKVRLNFSKNLSSQNYGFVYAAYRLKRPDVKEMVFTRMKQHYAHHVFPCFNRIGMKAKFKVKIGHVKNVNSFTNAEFIPRQLDYQPQTWVVDEFAKTGSISTFSVALAVVGYDSYGPATLMIGPPNTDLSEVKVQVWAEKDLLNDFHLKEVLRVAAQSLAFFSDFFHSTYNVGKLDVIVLPLDDITVEDSYGLIYLGEKVTHYVFTESTRYREDRYFLVSKICQASSKQWIGHLVSPSEWNEEWFFEGLHTYLQRHCIVELFEDWKSNVQLDLIDSFINLMRVEERGQDYNPILKLGSLRSFYKPLNPETRLKIHLIIRMLSFILELKKHLFQKSLVDFVNEFQSSNPDLFQLYDSWTKTANAETEVQIFPEDGYDVITIRKLISSWLYEKGHPLITVSRNKSKNVISLTQQPFKFPGQKESGSCWITPFDIVTKNQEMSSIRKTRKWLRCSTLPSAVPEIPVDANEDDWIIVSLGLHVPGRVHYEEMDSWLLIKSLFHNEKEILAIDRLTRIQLIHDMFTLAEASYLDYDFVFDTMKYISYENHYGCWHVFHHELNRLRSRWVGTNLFEPFQRLVRTIIEPIFKNKVIGIENFLTTRRSTNILGQIIIKTACTFELSYCNKYSQTHLESLISSAYRADRPTIQIPELLIKSIYCNAMKDADEKTWDLLLNKYKEDPENSKILAALGCSKNISILKKYLKWSTDVNNPHTSAQVGLKVFEILSSSNTGYQLIMQYFVTHRLKLSKNKELIALTEFINKFKENLDIDDFLIRALQATNQRSYLNMLEKFSETLPDRKTEKIAMEKEAISIINRTISWFETKAEKLSEYFSKL